MSQHGLAAASLTLCDRLLEVDQILPRRLQLRKGNAERAADDGLLGSGNVSDPMQRGLHLVLGRREPLLRGPDLRLQLRRIHECPSAANRRLPRTDRGAVSLQGSAGLQETSVQTLPSSQDIGVPEHRPLLHTSPDVQAFPSSQGAVLAMNRQPPTPSQTSHHVLLLRALTESSC